jgi:hypothetical protein
MCRHVVRATSYRPAHDETEGAGVPNSATIDAVRALTLGDKGAALRAARRDDSLLGEALARYLSAEETGRAAGQVVYDQPAAFQAFITGGGNVGLYDATARALAAVYDAGDASSLLDIGCGDGAALVPALGLSALAPSSVDLVDASERLLAAAAARLREMAIVTRVHPVPAQVFASDLAPGRHWVVAQSTFALHAVPHDERAVVLQRLREHLDTLALVEFDVPGHDPGSDEHVTFLADTYEQGLAEYDDDRDLVAGGFLMPVLVGQLLPGADRVTHEQPADQWLRQLDSSGYTPTECRLLFPYWSSPAVIITARSG